MIVRHLSVLVAAAAIGLMSGCQSDTVDKGGRPPSVLAEVPSVRLNFRYEADVPAPEIPQQQPAEERNVAVQTDFDQNRPQELLDKTITSPDQKRVLAVYHGPADLPSEYRLDMYAADGKVLRRITPDAMAVHFPDTIVWSPDSSSVAFVAMTRTASQVQLVPVPGQPDGNQAAANTLEPQNSIDSNSDGSSSNTAEAGNSTATEPVPAGPLVPEAPANVLTFRTEQIYTCGADGDGVKPITTNEGLIYFYYAWSPDGSMLVSLAATAREWQYLQYQADSKGEAFLPVGRPRLVEKTGRERRLDDGLTAVRPVWSPDSAKIAAAFDTQVRIYDSRGNNPTQAAIPLRNQLLISSRTYDRDQQLKLQPANSDAPAAPAVPESDSTLPDSSTLVSFNPIVDLQWSSDDLLYFQTAYVKRMKNEADSVTSFARWHRLVLTPQASELNK